MAKKQEPEKILHGNMAKVDPDKSVPSLYESNMVTTSNQKQHETPLSSDEHVEYVRKFEEENKK